MPFQTTTPVASAARTTSGSSAVQASDGNELSVEVVVTAASGTSPSLVISVEWSLDGTNFSAADPADAMTARTNVSRAVKHFTAKGPFYRIVWTITGTTPSFTFAVNAYTN